MMIQYPYIETLWTSTEDIFFGQYVYQFLQTRRKWEKRSSNKKETQNKQDVIVRMN